MMTYGGVDRGTRWRWMGQLHGPAALSPGKQPQVPIRQEAGDVDGDNIKLYNRDLGSKDVIRM
jgi:hypothetical protein